MSWKKFVGGVKNFGRKSTKFVSDAGKGVYKEVLKPVGREVFGLVKDARKTAQGLQKNAVGLTSPSQILMYGVGIIVVISLLPKILDTKAAEKAAERI